LDHIFFAVIAPRNYRIFLVQRKIAVITQFKVTDFGIESPFAT